ncbi:hypothetical protein PMAYCL1PPCAC_28170, partial [Pristionchus mayeri]
MASQLQHDYRRPTKVYRNCHVITRANSNHAKGKGRRRTGGESPDLSVPSITSMTFLDEHTLITASESGKSGIRLWDTRRGPEREESRPLAVLEVPCTSSREAGVSSMCLDRFKSSLFAVSTDNCIHEFLPNSGRVEPVRSYVGSSTRSDFQVKIACSPISDHILCGSGDGRALMWDASKFHSYSNQRFTGPASVSQKGINPVLSLGGHNNKVSFVGFSANAKYMLTMGYDEFRIWRRHGIALEEGHEMNDVASFERVEKLEQPREDEASRVMERISITPGPRLFLSPTKAGMAPLVKRKEPFSSPCTSSKRLFVDKENAHP